MLHEPSRVSSERDGEGGRERERKKDLRLITPTSTHTPLFPGLVQPPLSLLPLVSFRKDVGLFDEVVFAGVGEPLLRWSVVKEARA